MNSLFPYFYRQAQKIPRRPHIRRGMFRFSACQRSTAPRLALVTSRAYRASQPVFTLGSGWT